MFEGKRLVDLSMDIYEGMPKFWGDYHAPVRISVTGTYERNACMVRKLEMASHSGTHIDAPAHFFEGGITIDRVPLEKLMGTAIVVDLTDIREGDVIGVEQVRRKQIGPDVGVILKTRWHKRWETGGFYRGFPVLSPESITYLAGSGIRFLAVDIPLGVDAHRAFLSAGIILIENLTNLEAITQDEVTLIALPLRVRDGDGAPARVIAVLDD